LDQFLLPYNAFLWQLFMNSITHGDRHYRPITYLSCIHAVAGGTCGCRAEMFIIIFSAHQTRARRLTATPYQAAVFPPRPSADLRVWNRRARAVPIQVRPPRPSPSGVTEPPHRTAPFQQPAAAVFEDKNTGCYITRHDEYRR